MSEINLNVTGRRVWYVNVNNFPIVLYYKWDYYKNTLQVILLQKFIANDFTIEHWIGIVSEQK